MNLNDLITIVLQITRVFRTQNRFHLLLVPHDNLEECILVQPNFKMMFIQELAVGGQGNTRVFSNNVDQ